MERNVRACVERMSLQGYSSVDAQLSSNIWVVVYMD
jgi:hypothetical protein